MVVKSRRRFLWLEKLEARTLLAGDVVFAEPVVYSAGRFPGEVHAWDINGDEILDLVVGNETTCCGTDVRVLLGNGDGTFQDSHIFSPGGSRGIAKGDFDMDGELDLAVNVVRESAVLVFLNEGSSEAEWYGLSQAEGIFANTGHIASGDFDGDEYPDLALAGNSVSVVLNNGVSNGRWQGFAEPFDLTAAGTYVASGDMDNNGDLDLVVGNRSRGEVAVLLSSGNGNFQAPEKQRVPVSIEAIRLANLDGDEYLDVAVVGTNAQRVPVLLGNGDGTLADPVNVPISSRIRDVRAGDLDSDGDSDLVVVPHDENLLRLLINDGDGSFHVQESGVVAGADPQAAAMGDLDGDGDVDLATAHAFSRNAVDILINLTDRIGDVVWDGNAAVGTLGDGVSWSDPNNWTVDGLHDMLPRVEFPGDIVTFPSGMASVTVNLGQDRIARSLIFETDVTLDGNVLTITSGQLTVPTEITATVNSSISNSNGVTKKGEGTLIVGGVADEMVLEAGTIRGDGTIAELLVVHGATVSPGISVGRITIGRDVRIEGTLLIELAGADNDVLDVGNNVFLLEGSTLELNAMSSLLGPGETIRTIVTGRRGGRFTSEPAIGQHFGAGVFATEVADTGSAVVYTNRSVTVSLFQAAGGDANGDRRFDQQDIVEVLQAGKYLTERLADWNEGDWNNDGVFDQLDVVVALQAADYLQGAYAVSSVL